MSIDDLKDLEKKVVTKRPPTEREMAAMSFGWRVVKHVKSNAIVYADSDRTLGIGAGQMSRVDASRIARLESERSWAVSLWQRSGERRFLSVSRWINRRGRCRRDLCHSTGWIGARC